MIQENLFQTTSLDKFDLLTKDEVIELLHGEESLRVKFQNENAKLKAEMGKNTQQTINLDEKYILLRDKLYGKSSEKSKKENNKKNKNSSNKKRIRLPSERYPNIPVVKKQIPFEEPPNCDCCGDEMAPTGMQESSEKLTVIPKRYIIELYLRDKYSCKGCETLKTAALPPQIAPGGSFSNEFILDIGLSKYCDLIPIERYCEMAARQGLRGLAQNSIIEQTHHLAEFFKPIYEKCNIEVFFNGEDLVKADETPQKMLEGNKRSNWYLWGFSTSNACYFEARDTRSGDVAWEHLQYSTCKYLLTDVFSGYKKAIRKANEMREKYELPPILGAYCNAHARRKFKDAEKTFRKIFSKEILNDPDFIDKDLSQFFIKQFKKIYKIEKYVKKVKELYPAGLKDKECFDKCLRLREMMRKYFLQMRDEIPKIKFSNSSNSSIGKAVRYLDNNFEGLTHCLKYPEIDIDNNSQERLFRSVVVGRKTWLGTHSARGAETASILFTLVEGAKLNGLNPREYFNEVVKIMLSGGDPLTPYEYAQLKNLPK